MYGAFFGDYPFRYRSMWFSLICNQVCSVLKTSISFSWWDLILWTVNGGLFWSCFSEMQALGSSIERWKFALRVWKGTLVFWGRLGVTPIELTQVKLLIRLQSYILKLCLKQSCSALQPFLPHLFQLSSGCSSTLFLQCFWQVQSLTRDWSLWRMAV